ncbi:MAG: radical SAM protein [Patescibacteria group bacterium]
MREAISLIIPPSAFLLDERVFMTLGILKVAAAVEARGRPVDVLDLSGIKNFIGAVHDYASSTPTRYFGITATTPQMPAAISVAEAIRSVRSDARVILGGPHITLVAAAVKGERRLGITGRASRSFQKLYEHFDVVVAGDGELAIELALQSAAPQFIDADDPTQPLFLTNQDLEGLPFPARHLVDVDSYHYTIEGERALSLIAQLGCPFECGFCGGRQSPFLRRVRTRQSAHVIQEIVHLTTVYGVRGVMLYDDELNVNRNMLELMRGIYEAQEKIGVEWRFRGFIKSQLFTDAQAEAMYHAGFRWILVGFESGAPRILENINKRATLDENTRCMEIARRHGLKVKALMSIGHPGESFETIHETRDWLLKMRPDDFDVTIITTYPGTPYYDFALPFQDNPATWVYTCKKTDDRLYSLEVDYTKTTNYYKGIPGEYSAYVATDFLTSDELVRERDMLETAVRDALGIPFNASVPALLYEHSMGQLPPYILRSTS